MISTVYHDDLTGRRVGRCGEWLVRAQHDGTSFDVAHPPVKSWNEIPSDSSGLPLDVAARVLGVPQGELYKWGRGNW